MHCERVGTVLVLRAKSYAAARAVCFENSMDPSGTGATERERARERERESEILEYYGVIIYSSYQVTYDSETPFSTKNTHRAPHVTRLSFTSDTK